MPKTILILLFATLLSSGSNASVNITATIKPLQLIAAAIVGDYGSVTAILEPQQSPHHYTMSPSDRIALARADVTLWVGPTFETFLSDFFAQADIRAKSITALELSEMRLHSLAEGHGDAHAQVDAHLWLDTENAAAIALAIMERVVELDPANEAGYRENLKSFQAELEASNDEISARFATPSTKSYAVYHNAYQYFERQFNLQHQMVILRDPETQPSMREIVALRQQVAEIQPSCILLEFDSSEELLRTVLNGHQATLITVDLLGSAVTIEANAYGEFISSIADDFHRCLYE